ncbi:hypothetical protein E2562_013400 [Oryza meyeriana var. granulata]|uniref:Uncharacterized protein n=1 Tax=Oryza meyeriana var. granulata TaxID=110450 RepID=A0A6G1EB65_9ORYZ|nr:hypothetical protein E2562_013400 [Oryza meyeriana var. granulata]
MAAWAWREVGRVGHARIGSACPTGRVCKAVGAVEGMGEGVAQVARVLGGGVHRSDTLLGEAVLEGGTMASEGAVSLQE